MLGEKISVPCIATLHSYVQTWHTLSIVYLEPSRVEAPRQDRTRLIVNENAFNISIHSRHFFQKLENIKKSLPIGLASSISILYGQTAQIKFTWKMKKKTLGTSLACRASMILPRECSVFISENHRFHLLFLQQWKVGWSKKFAVRGRGMGGGGGRG